MRELKRTSLKVQTLLHICVAVGIWWRSPTTGGIRPTARLYLEWPAPHAYPHSVSAQGVSLNSKPEADKSKIMATSSNREESQERYTRNCATAIMGCKSEGWNWPLLYDFITSCLMENVQYQILTGKNPCFMMFKWLNNEAQTVIFYKLVKMNRKGVAFLWH